MAEIVKVSEPDAIKKAARVLRKRGVIIYPTETCYGMGCIFEYADAKERIYRIKQRSRQKPLPTIVGSLEVARRYAPLPRLAEKLALAFYPRPLTLVVSDEFAFRISSHPFAHELARVVNRAIVSTSANLSGKGEIYSAKKVIELFSKKVDLIVDGGDLPKRPPSTVFDLRTLTVLRVGEIKEREIQELLKFYSVKL